MGLLDAVVAAGFIGEPSKKRYSEVLSQKLAQEVAAGLRGIGFPNVKPLQGGAGEKAFQGGLGPKRVDVSYADERHGLILAVSIKTITSEPFGKNLKNRFYDLCLEGITLHLRFPYSVVCALFCFPNAANEDVTPSRKVSTFERARKLLATISGRQEYTDPGEKFENVTMMLFQPVTHDPTVTPLGAPDRHGIQQGDDRGGILRHDPANLQPAESAHRDRRGRP
ncbi:MAG: hypothetical protein ACP5XB_03070 [Isosphaeraceae bacterium]